MKLQIKQLFVKAKHKIKAWLISDELKDIEELKARYEHMIKMQEYYERLLLEARKDYQKAEKIVVDCQKLMNSICDVGTDIGLYNDHSWAVICVHGKVDYVRFIDMRREDVMSIVKFLKNFEYSNRITDSPLGHKEFLEDMIIKF